MWSAPATKGARFKAGGYKRVEIKHPPVRTLRDMSEDEIQEIERVWRARGFVITCRRKTN
jgi:hypothetical protein